MLRIKKHSDKIYAIGGDSREEVARAFMHFQEYYENPIYKGKKFTFENIVDWHNSIHATPYWDEWAGFNVPGEKIFEVIMDENYRSFNFLESELVMLLMKTFQSLQQLKDCYIIGVSENDSDYADILKHEIAHGLFTTNLEYKAKQLENINNLPKDAFTHLHKLMCETGYHEDTVVDEIHAYMLTDQALLFQELPQYNFEELSKPFEKTFEEYK